jgi:hypothetical protein
MSIWFPSYRMELSGSWRSSLRTPLTASQSFCSRIASKCLIRILRPSSFDHLSVSILTYHHGIVRIVNEKMEYQNISGLRGLSTATVFIGQNIRSSSFCATKCRLLLPLLTINCYSLCRSLLIFSYDG